MLGALRTYIRRLNAQSHAVWQRHGRPLFQSGPYLQFCNDVVFPFFDCLDSLVASKAFRTTRKVVLFGSLFTLASAGCWAVLFAERKLKQAKELDPQLVHQSADLLGDVLKRFVFQNEFISNMLSQILMKQVFANERIRFMLARSLGRVLVSPSIQSQVNYLVKVPVLHQSVLNNPDIQRMLSGLVGELLRNETVQRLLMEQLLQFAKSETAESLMRNGAADGLRLPIVRKLFTEGVVDDTIYKKLTDKALARQLDQQLTEFLEN